METNALKEAYTEIQKQLHRETWGIITGIFLVIKLFLCWISSTIDFVYTDPFFLVANGLSIFCLVTSFCILVIPKDYGSEYDKLNK